MVRNGEMICMYSEAILTLMNLILQPSAAKQIISFDESKDGDERKELSNFGLRTDIYGKKSQKVRSSFPQCFL